jgi:hypothetical protein
MIVKMLHNKVLRSEHMYMASLASIGLTVVSWVGSMRYEPVGGVSRADCGGIFVGEWAPTFFGRGWPSLTTSTASSPTGTTTRTRAVRPVEHLTCAGCAGKSLPWRPEERPPR